MAYKDFADSYVKWLQSQLEYLNGKPYANFFVTINPTYEITAFKNSIDINQQKIFHNAADDQVAFLRTLTEINKKPSDYLNEYEDYLNFEISLIQAAASEIENTHKTQDSSSKTTLQFYSNFAPKILDDLGRYNPMRILT